jgi:hypothetical protein
MTNTSSGGSTGSGKEGNFANDPDRASEAGKKGGQHSHGSDKTSKGSFKGDHEKASEAGKKGGEHSHDRQR